MWSNKIECYTDARDWLSEINVKCYKAQGFEIKFTFFDLLLFDQVDLIKIIFGLLANCVYLGFDENQSRQDTWCWIISEVALVTRAVFINFAARPRLKNVVILSENKALSLIQPET